MCEGIPVGLANKGGYLPGPGCSPHSSRALGQRSWHVQGTTRTPEEGTRVWCGIARSGSTERPSLREPGLAMGSFPAVRRLHTGFWGTPWGCPFLLALHPFQLFGAQPLAGPASEHHIQTSGHQHRLCRHLVENSINLKSTLTFSLPLGSVPQFPHS